MFGIRCCCSYRCRYNLRTLLRFLHVTFPVASIYLPLPYTVTPLHSLTTFDVRCTLRFWSTWGGLHVTYTHITHPSGYALRLRFPLHHVGFTGRCYRILPHVGYTFTLIAFCLRYGYTRGSACVLRILDYRFYRTPFLARCVLRVGFLVPLHHSHCYHTGRTFYVPPRCRSHLPRITTRTPTGSTLPRPFTHSYHHVTHYCHCHGLTFPGPALRRTPTCRSAHTTVASFAATDCLPATRLFLDHPRCHTHCHVTTSPCLGYTATSHVYGCSYTPCTVLTRSLPLPTRTGLHTTLLQFPTTLAGLRITLPTLPACILYVVATAPFVFTFYVTTCVHRTRFTSPRTHLRLPYTLLPLHTTHHTTHISRSHVYYTRLTRCVCCTFRGLPTFLAFISRSLRCWIDSRTAVRVVASHTQFATCLTTVATRYSRHVPDVILFIHYTPVTLYVPHTLRCPARFPATTSHRYHRHARSVVVPPRTPYTQLIHVHSTPGSRLRSDVAAVTRSDADLHYLY